jgi:branched-chain amino acid transport system permease protein
MQFYFASRWIPRPLLRLFELEFSAIQGHFIFRWIAAFAFLTPLLVWRLARSPRGQTIRAVREDEVAATAVGIDPTRQKVTAFVIGAALAGVGGGLFAHCFYYLNPNSFGFMRSVELVVMVTIAGLGNVWWTVVWAAALTYLEEDFLRTIGQHLGYPQLAQWRMVLYSLLLILIPILQAKLFPRLRGAWRRKIKSATDEHR